MPHQGESTKLLPVIASCRNVCRRTSALFLNVALLTPRDQKLRVHCASEPAFSPSARGRGIQFCPLSYSAIQRRGHPESAGAKSAERQGQRHADGGSQMVSETFNCGLHFYKGAHQACFQGALHRFQPDVHVPRGGARPAEPDRVAQGAADARAHVQAGQDVGGTRRGCGDARLPHRGTCDPSLCVRVCVCANGRTVGRCN